MQISSLHLVPLEGLKSQAAFDEMRQNYIRELTKAIQMKEKGIVASSQRFYHLTKLMDAIHDVGSPTELSITVYIFATLTTTKTQIDVSFLTDSKEDQPVLFEYLHPGRCHESGVSRDDVRGHCLPASQGPCWHGEAPLIPQQMTLPTQILQLCEDSLCLDYSSHCYWILQSLHFAKMPLICLRLNRMTRFLKMFLAETYLENYTFRGINQ